MQTKRATKHGSGEENNIKKQYRVCFFPKEIQEIFVCFVLWYINLIGHLMPNQVKENKSEKKFKGEVLGINDKLQIISWLFVFVLLGVYLQGNMIIKKKPCETSWGKDQLEYIQ